MTEVEAKKILDFLARRFEKTSKVLVEQFSKDDITDNLIVKLKHHGSFFVWKFDNNGFDYDNFAKTVKIYDEMTMSNVVSHLFNHAKISDLLVFGNIFVFKRESLEEIKVKMDLENI